MQAERSRAEQEQEAASLALIEKLAAMEVRTVRLPSDNKASALVSDCRVGRLDSINNFTGFAYDSLCCNADNFNEMSL